MRVKNLRMVCILASLTFSASVFSQSTLLIENGGRHDVIHDESLGDTFVGGYTSSNSLNVLQNSDGTTINFPKLTTGDVIVGGMDSASFNTATVSGSNVSWTAGSMAIGCLSNQSNVVTVKDGGTIELGGALSIRGINNQFILGSYGTLDVGADFHAAMEGFSYASNTTLKVGGMLTGMASVDKANALYLYGAGASWSVSNGTILVGHSSSSNSLTLADGATLVASNLTIGAASSSGNRMLVSGSSVGLQELVVGTHGSSGNRLEVDGNGTLSVSNMVVGASSNAVLLSNGGRLVLDGSLSMGSNSTFTVRDSGILELNTDLDIGASGVSLAEGAVLTAHQHLTLDQVGGGISVNLEGSQAVWTNLSGSTLNVGLLEKGNKLSVSSNAVLAAGTFVVGSTNNSSIANVVNVATKGQLTTGNLYLGGVDKNYNTLNITDGGLVNAAHIYIGGVSNGINNSVNIESGGHLTVDSGISIGATNELRVINGGKLTFLSDVSIDKLGPDAVFQWGNGGILEGYGHVPIYTNWFVDETYVDIGEFYLRRGQHLILNGELANMNSAAKHLHVGDSYANNSFSLINNASAALDSISIGDFAGAGNGNSVVVSNGSSLVSTKFLALGGSYLSGTWYDGGADNTFLVLDGSSFETAEVRIGGNSNRFVVDGIGSTVTNLGHLFMSGTNNALEVSNSAHMLVSSNFTSSGGAMALQLGTNATLNINGAWNSSSAESLVSMKQGAVFLNAGDVHLGGNQNELQLTGAGTAFNTGGDLLLNGSSQNLISVFDGATLTATGGLTTGGSYSELLLGTNATMTVGGAWDGSAGDALVSLVSGATFANTGDVRFGGSTNRFQLTGAGTAFNAGGDLLLDGSSQNLISVLDGATLTAAGGLTTGGTYSELLLGTNATMTVGGAWNGSAGDTLVSLVSGAMFSNTGDVRFGGSQNQLQLMGAGTVFSAGGNLLMNGANQNLISVLDGATLTAAGGLVTDGTYGGMMLGANATMTVDGAWDNSADYALVSLVSGATFSNTADVHFGGSQNRLQLSGAGTAFSAGGDLLMNGANQNLISVLDGATLSSVDGLTTGGTYSELTVGTNATMNVGGEFALASALNDVFVADGGVLRVGGQLNNDQRGGIRVSSGGSVFAQNYHQSADSYLQFDFEQSLVGVLDMGTLVVSKTADFAEDSRIMFDNVGMISLDEIYTNKIVEAQTLVVAGKTNVVTADLDAFRVDGSLIDSIFEVRNQDIWVFLNRRDLADAAGFEAGTMMYDVANEIDLLSQSGSSAASNQVTILNGMSGAQVNAQLRQLNEYNAPTYMHGRAIHDGVGLVMSRSSTFHLMVAEGAKPNGAGGPHAAGQDLRGWTMGYGNFGSYDAGGESVADGYDMQVYGTVVGLDKSFGSILLGVAGGYAGSALDTDGGDKSDATTGYGLFYASYGSDEWFGDLVASYGAIDIESRSGSAFDVTSEVQAAQSSVYLGAGKEWEIKDSVENGLEWRFRPQAGLRVSLYDQNAYTETSPNAVGKEVDAYDRMSYLSTLGGSLVFPKAYKSMGIETEVRAAWLHEFNADTEQVGYSLIGGNNRYQFAMQSPDENALDLGLSVKAIWLMGLELRAAVDGQIGSASSSATVSGSLLYSF